VRHAFTTNTVIPYHYNVIVLASNRLPILTHLAQDSCIFGQLTHFLQRRNYLTHFFSVQQRIFIGFWTPLGSLQHSPRPLTGFKGATSRGGEKREKEGLVGWCLTSHRRKEKEREGEGRGKEIEGIEGQSNALLFYHLGMSASKLNCLVNNG